MPEPLDPRFPSVVELADRQLDAYNAADVDAFCACFAEDVRVLNADGTLSHEGMAAFRAAYAKMFATLHEVRALILGRVVSGETLVEHERYARKLPDGAPQSGDILVRYTARDGKIAVVQFFG